MRQCPACGRTFKVEMPYCPDCASKPQAPAWNNEEAIRAERDMIAGIVPVLNDFLSPFSRLAGKQLDVSVSLNSSNAISMCGGSAVTLPVWPVGPEEIRKLYLEWAEGDEALARRYFDLSFYWFYYVHELGHVVQRYLSGMSETYANELNANEWATAFWYGGRKRTRDHDDWERLTERIIKWGRAKGYPERVTPQNFKEHYNCELGYYGYQEWALVDECRRRTPEITMDRMLGKYGRDFIDGVKENDLTITMLPTDPILPELKAGRIDELLRGLFSAKDMPLSPAARVVLRSEGVHCIEDGARTFTVLEHKMGTRTCITLFKGYYPGRGKQ